MDPLLSLQNATVKSLDKTIFVDLDFEWKKGQHWAIIGPSGTEQTAFLDTLMGKTILSKGILEKPFAKAYQDEKTEKGEINSFRDLIASVSQDYQFRNKSNLQNFYYQQRFNSMESEDTATVGDYLEGIEVKLEGPWDKEKTMVLMRLTALRGKSLIKLSNGETRRLTIASALMKNPKLLFLDQPMTGLDIASRRYFGFILQEIIASGTHVIMSANPNEIPECITHLAVLKNKKIDELLENTKELGPLSGVNRSLEFDWELLKNLLKDKPDASFQTIVDLKAVTITYGDKVILDKVGWTIAPGDRWVLKGDNGAGKSTLLSLLLGENPQAYANDIWLFGRKRGTGESIWDIKKHVGFVAPELSRYFPRNQTCLKVVLSGLFDTMGLFKKVNREEESLARVWLELFNLSNIGQVMFHQISVENQRFVLLARAMIKMPALLILDEASQGLDAQQSLLFRNTIDQICAYTSISMIFVSHYEEAIPNAFTKILHLENGRVI
ncbi:ATP-binding cassette domain-containing protein [Rhodonellum sp.]|uniref:ATP-binding cassette domain-containing protein n=1 Tax=Rhodonellum sp. TaxID=2231180 RepID=UPI002726E76E|nr:ATP-binding cassette domain-containing protein [Rhodonellum sp.]MDO9550876.1 ATP-binding cassette domain-containing protein [Rhodonellum sp.]